MKLSAFVDLGRNIMNSDVTGRVSREIELASPVEATSPVFDLASAAAYLDSVAQHNTEFDAGLVALANTFFGSATN